jgi:hypothetical protein
MGKKTMNGEARGRDIHDGKERTLAKLQPTQLALFQMFLTFPIYSFGMCSCGFLVHPRLCTKTPTFPQSFVQDGILHKKWNVTFSH